MKIKYKILRLPLVIASFTMLLVTATGAKVKDTESIKVRQAEFSSTPQTISVHSERPQMTETAQKSKVGEKINWRVISGGGSIDGISASYTLGVTIGQIATGSGTSANNGLSLGFWQDFAIESEYLCGDANGDETVNVGDAVFLINYVFKGGAAPDPLEAGDANCDGQVNVGDAVYLIAYVFKGGPEPCGACE
jgi:hypothetical protein